MVIAEPIKNVEEAQKIEKSLALIKQQRESLNKQWQALYSQLELLRGNNHKLITDVKGQPLKCALYMDGYLKSNLDITHELIMNDFDNIGLIVGYEGTGKSMLALQIAYYLDATFSIKDICFTDKQIIERIEELEKKGETTGKALVWDEADDLSRSWNDKITFTLKRLGKRMRKLNLHLIIVTPTFFDMGKYWAIMRTRYLIEPYSIGKDRGFFRFFNRKQKRLLYIHGRKEWDMNKARESFKGRFLDLPKDFPINIQEYQKKKSQATFGAETGSLQGEERQAAIIRKNRLEILGNMLDWPARSGKEEFSYKEMAFLLGIKFNTLKTYIRDYNKIKKQAENAQIPGKSALRGFATNGT